MKTYLLIAFLFVTIGSTAQSKQLNKLFKQLVWTFNPNKPLSDEAAQEIVVPNIYNPDRLYTIKWKSIDSVRMYDTGGFNIHVYLYGKGKEYSLCDQKDKCSKKYFDSLYQEERTTDMTWIPFLSKNEAGVQILTTKLRKKLYSALMKLNNTPVYEKYDTVKRIFSPTRPPNKGIIVYLPGHLGQSYIPAEEIRQATELQPVLSTYPIVSFVFYISGAGWDPPPGPVFNQGPKFNKEVLRLLQYVRPGGFIVFDQIKVIDALVNERMAESFSIDAK